LAVNFGSEKSPKSESDSLSVTDFFDGFEISFAVADFLGTARLPVDVELFVFELFFEDFFDFFFELFSFPPASSSVEDSLRSFAERPFFNFLFHFN
jgi:hypothetical protein